MVWSENNEAKKVSVRRINSNHLTSKHTFSSLPFQHHWSEKNEAKKEIECASYNTNHLTRNIVLTYLGPITDTICPHCTRPEMLSIINFFLFFLLFLADVRNDTPQACCSLPTLNFKSVNDRTWSVLLQLLLSSVSPMISNDLFGFLMMTEGTFWRWRLSFSVCKIMATVGATFLSVAVELPMILH